MKIKVNSNDIDVPSGTTVADLLKSQQVPTEGTATAVNGKVIPRSEHVTFRLAEGDNIIVIKAFYGG